MDTSENDQIRSQILDFLYHRSLEARSVTQRRCAPALIVRHIKRLGYSKQQVVHNLGYLVDTGWIKRESQTSSHPGFGGTRPKTIKIKTDYYRISDKGINQFEQESKYEKKSTSGISITNIGGVTIVGNNNFVQTDQRELYEILEEMKNLVVSHGQVTDEKKLEFKSDLETVQAQLAKKNPIKDIISLSWSNLSALATVEGVISLYQKAETLIQRLLQ